MRHAWNRWMLHILTAEGCDRRFLWSGSLDWCCFALGSEWRFCCLFRKPSRLWFLLSAVWFWGIICSAVDRQERQMSWLQVWKPDSSWNATHSGQKTIIRHTLGKIRIRQDVQKKVRSAGYFVSVTKTRGMLLLHPTLGSNSLNIARYAAFLAQASIYLTAPCA